ncbi:MAG: TldD/PmbA family protein [Actinobacteria bacterium]|nr:TldD/PmbA family protein [Actinomycetota bacterium]
MVKRKNIKSLADFCKDASLKIKKLEVDEFEIYGASSTHNELELFNGQIDNLSFAETKGIGIRIFKDKRVGYSYTSILDKYNIEKCIDRAFSNSLITFQEEYNYLPMESEFKSSKGIIDKKILYSEDFFNFDIKQKINLAKELEILAKKKDKRITGINNLIYEDSLDEVMILNSTGFFDSYRTTSAFIYLSVISKEKDDTSTGDFFGYDRSPGKFNLEEIAANAVNRSVSILGGKKIKSQMVDIVLDPFIAAQFLGIIASIVTADTVQKGKSLLKDRIGDKIFKGDFDIIDDGTLSYGLASKPFDGEGVPKGKTAIFENGILKTYLYNTYTARKDKKFSTGNAVRSSYKSIPEVGVSNFYLKPSKTSLEKIIKSVDKGFYVIDIIGLHSGTNPISGQISVGAKGLWIDKGSFSKPVKEVTIATDLLSFCKSIDKISDDLKFMPSGGYIGSPSMLVKDIALSGK